VNPIALVLVAAVLVALAVFVLLRLVHPARNSTHDERSAPQPAAGEPLDAGTEEVEMPPPDTPRIIGSLDGSHPQRRVSRPAGVDSLARHFDNLEQGPFPTGGRPPRQPVQGRRSQRSMRKRLAMSLTRGQRPTTKQKAGWHFARENRASKITIMYDLVKAKWLGPLSSADENRIRHYGFRWWPELGWWILDCSRPRPHFPRRRANWWEVQGGVPDQASVARVIWTNLFRTRASKSSGDTVNDY
jgi:hypothetical protein